MRTIRTYGIIFTIATIIGGGWLWGLLAIIGFYFVPTTKCLHS